MQKSLMWIATAALFVSALGGQASQWNIVGMTVPLGTNGPAGNGIASASPRKTPRHDRFDAILHAPSAFSCQGDRTSTDVFERQCESNTSNN
jgi:hypothetical protein